jgi:hypothetical protein
VERHVELTDRAERLRQAADLPLGLPRLAVLEALCEHGDGLPEAAGCDPGLMHTHILARDGGGKLSSQGARATLEEADQR